MELPSIVQMSFCWICRQMPILLPLASYAFEIALELHRRIQPMQKVRFKRLEYLES